MTDSPRRRRWGELRRVTVRDTAVRRAPRPRATPRNAYGSGQPQSACQTHPGLTATGIAASALAATLLFDRELSQGSCLQAIVGDRGAALDRPTVCPRCDAGFGSLDRLHLLAQIGDEGNVDLLTIQVGSRLTRFTCLLLVQLLLGRNGCIKLPQASFDSRPFA